MSNIKNTIKYSVAFSLISVVVLTFAVIAPAVNAQAANCPTPSFDDRMNGTQVNANPTPTLYSINPSSVNFGSGSQSITVSGSGFIPGTIARWNGSNRPTTFIDDSHVLMYVSSSDINAKASDFITVWNPAPCGGYSNAETLNIAGYIAPGTVTGGGNPVQGHSPTTSGSGSTKSSTSNNSNSNNSGSVLGAQTDNGQSLAGAAIYGSNGFMPSGIIEWLLFAIFILIIVIIVRKIFFQDKYNSTPLKHA